MFKAEIISHGFFAMRLNGGEGALKSAVKDALKDGFKAAGMHHWQNTLPLHFTHQGATRYGYQKRKTGYEQRKLRRFGHTYPLVFTGQSKREILSRVNLSFTGKGVRVRVVAPRHIAVRRASDPSKVRELGAITGDEFGQLGQVIAAKFTEIVKDASKWRTVRKVIK